MSITDTNCPQWRKLNSYYNSTARNILTKNSRFLLQDERELNSTYKQEVDTNRQRLATAGRENERLRRQVSTPSSHNVSAVISCLSTVQAMRFTLLQTVVLVFDWLYLNENSTRKN